MIIEAVEVKQLSPTIKTYCWRTVNTVLIIREVNISSTKANTVQPVMNGDHQLKTLSNGYVFTLCPLIP